MILIIFRWWKRSHGELMSKTTFDGDRWLVCSVIKCLMRSFSDSDYRAYISENVCEAIDKNTYITKIKMNGLKLL